MMRRMSRSRGLASLRCRESRESGAHQEHTGEEPHRATARRAALREAARRMSRSRGLPSARRGAGSRERTGAHQRGTRTGGPVRPLAHGETARRRSRRNVYGVEPGECECAEQRSTPERSLVRRTAQRFALREAARRTGWSRGPPAHGAEPEPRGRGAHRFAPERSPHRAAGCLAF